MQDFLFMLSRTFRIKTQKTSVRKGLIVQCLSDDCEFPPEGVDGVIAVLRKKGYAEKLTRDIVYRDKTIYKQPFRYFNGDTILRDMMDRKRIASNNDDYLGLNSLLADHPDIKTREDLEAKMQAVIVDPGPPPSPNPQTSDGWPASKEDTALYDEMSQFFIKHPAQIAQTHLGVAGFGMRFKAYIAQQQQQKDHDRRMIANLQRERAHLRRSIAEWVKQGKSVSADAMGIDGHTQNIEYALLIATHGLPEKTSTNSGHWKKEIPIQYSQGRNEFCERLQSDEYNENAPQIAKALRMLASQGQGYRSLESEVFRRPLPGIPAGIKDFTYSRASLNVRFAWKELGRFIQVFNLYKHKSGGGSLPDIS